MHLQYYPVRVNQSSTVSILSVAYSVPSRLIAYTLKAYISSEEIELYYGNKCLQKMSRISHGYVINYRYIIDSLVRKNLEDLPNINIMKLYFHVLYFVRYMNHLISIYPCKGQ